jgi:putative N-acetylmannosamine-6-phosphate epimerase
MISTTPRHDGVTPGGTIPRGALVVSCQAAPEHPLHGGIYMTAMARAAAEGGAGGIRANGPADIAAIRAAVSLPLIGLLKREDPGFPVIITPDFSAAQAVAEAGADIVALDATGRPRGGGADLADLIRRIHDELCLPVMADCASVADGVAAAGLGADYVASTLSGYTDGGPPGDAPDLALVAALVERCGGVPVVAEGRFTTPAQVAAAFACGAHAVVIGTAITDPRAITRRFVAATPR